MREKQQALWDKIALLELLQQSVRVGQVRGNLWLQKLTFLVELEGLRAGLSPMHFRFFRYTWGPYSAPLANDVKFLEERGFLASTTRRITKRGQYLINYVKTAIENSAEAREARTLMSRVAERYARHSGVRLRDIVYKLVVPVFELGGEELRVRDIPVGYDILDPARTLNIRDVQPLDERLIANVEEELSIPPEVLLPTNPNYRKVVKAALDRLSKS